MHEVSSANVHDSRYCEQLLDAGYTARAISADSASLK